jgi:hypothetical protein
VPFVPDRRSSSDAPGLVPRSHVAAVWSGATSLLMYLETPGPAEVFVPEGQDRTTVIDRVGALRLVHAHELLVATGAHRLPALARHCRAQAGETASLGGGWTIARRRLRGAGTRRWRFAFRAVSRSSRARAAALWAEGADLAETAAALLAAAGSKGRDEALADSRLFLARVDRGALVADPATGDQVRRDGPEH